MCYQMFEDQSKTKPACSQTFTQGTLDARNVVTLWTSSMHGNLDAYLEGAKPANRHHHGTLACVCRQCCSDTSHSGRVCIHLHARAGTSAEHTGRGWCTRIYCIVYFDGNSSIGPSEWSCFVDTKLLPTSPARTFGYRFAMYVRRMGR
jgi:hypothetical protein